MYAVASLLPEYSAWSSRWGQMIDFNFMAQELTMDLILFRVCGILLCLPDGDEGLASASFHALAQRLQADSIKTKGDRQAGVADDAGGAGLPDFILRRGGRSWLNSLPRATPCAILNCYAS